MIRSEDQREKEEVSNSRSLIFFFFSFSFPTFSYTTHLETRNLHLLSILPRPPPPLLLLPHSHFPPDAIMFKLVTLLVLVIALIAGSFAQEERAAVAAAPATAPRRAGPPSAAPTANEVSLPLVFPFSFLDSLSGFDRDGHLRAPIGRKGKKGGTAKASTSPGAKCGGFDLQKK